MQKSQRPSCIVPTDYLVPMDLPLMPYNIGGGADGTTKVMAVLVCHLARGQLLDRTGIVKQILRTVFGGPIFPAHFFAHAKAPACPSYRGVRKSAGARIISHPISHRTPRYGVGNRGTRRFVIGEKFLNFRIKRNCTIQDRMGCNGLGNRRSRCHI